MLVPSVTILLYFFIGFGLANNAQGGVVGYYKFAGTDFGPEDYYSFVLQFTFCSASASAVTGSLAERSTVSSVCIFIVVYSVVIFPVLHSWVWGDGWLQWQNFIDYSGSGVAYMTGGVCSTIGAIFIGPRHGFCSNITAKEKEILDNKKSKDKKKLEKKANALRKSIEVQKKGEDNDDLKPGSGGTKNGDFKRQFSLLKPTSGTSDRTLGGQYRVESKSTFKKQRTRKALMSL